LLLLNVAFYGWTRLADHASPPAAPEGGAVRRLELFSERGGAARARCTSVGPFAEQTLAERAFGQLRGADREPSLRRVDAEGAAGFRVVLSAPSLERASSTAMRLRAAGVGDLEIVPPEAGGTQALVVLGTYSDRERAQRRAEDLRRYAIAPTVAEVTRSATSWWVDVLETTPAASLEPAALVRAVGSPPGVALVPCPAAGAQGTAPAGVAAATTPPQAPAAAPVRNTAKP
jgi:hypothetical protein